MLVVSANGAASRLVAAQVDQQDLRALFHRERDRELIRDSNTVTLGQDDVVQCRLAVEDMEPGAPARQQLVDKMTSGVENTRVDQGVLVNSQRSLASVRGHDDAEHVVALRHGETPLLVGTDEPDLCGAQG